LGNEAFLGCVGLKEIIIPASVAAVNHKCFYGCTGITKVTIENGVKNIEGDTFIGCTSLTELNVPDSVTSFDLCAIINTGIKHFVFPKNIRYTKFYTPKHVDELTLDYVVIQSGTKILDYNWFYAYSSLKAFYYEGTEAEYADVKKQTAPNNQSIFDNGENMPHNIEVMKEWIGNLTVYYYSEEEPEGEGNYWHYVDGVPTKW